MNRRSALAGVSLVAMAACGPTGNAPTVQSVLNVIQFALPLLDAMALGISVVVPGSAAVMAGAMTLLNQAGPIFQTLDATMTAAQAQPIVRQVETYIAGALQAVAGVVNTTPSLAAYQTRVAQAQAALGMLTTFVNGVTGGVPVAARAPRVAIPLLHR
jgi:hypothetical protein